MLMHERRELKARERHTAGRGMFQPGDTCYCQRTSKIDTVIEVTLDNQLEPGKPRSRANAQICREAVATSMIQQMVNKMMI